MANGDDMHDRYPLPHERMVPVELLDEARAIARRLAEDLRDELGDEGPRLTAALRAFDALPWANES